MLVVTGGSGSSGDSHGSVDTVCTRLGRIDQRVVGSVFHAIGHNAAVQGAADLIYVDQAYAGRSIRPS